MGHSVSFLQLGVRSIALHVHGLAQAGLLKTPGLRLTGPGEFCRKSRFQSSSAGHPPLLLEESVSQP